MIDYNIMGPEALFKVNSGQQTNSRSALAFRLVCNIIFNPGVSWEL